MDGLVVYRCQNNLYVSYWFRVRGRDPRVLPSEHVEKIQAA